MNRVLALQSLPEAYFGFGDDLDSNISNICSSESIDCSSQSFMCSAMSVVCTTEVQRDW